MKSVGVAHGQERFEFDLPEGAYLDVLRYKNWRHRIMLHDKVCTPGYISEYTWHHAHFPTDLKGKSVLDIGANDGLNAFCAEKFGAKSVTAVDLYAHTPTLDHQAGWSARGIHMAHRYLNSKVDIQYGDVYDLERLGRTFDVVIFADIMSWLENIPAAIRSISKVTGEMLIIREGFLRQAGNLPKLRYDHGSTGTHYFTPNLQFIREILREHGFQRVEAKRMIISTLYDHWVTSFPILYATKPVKFYEDPWSDDPQGEWPGLQDQALMKVGKRFCVRGKGWVDADKVKSDWIALTTPSRILRGIIGQDNFMRLKDRYQKFPSDSYTILAYRK